MRATRSDGIQRGITLLVATADPMPGRTAFEVGAGHVDAYEAGVLAGGN